MIHDEIKKLYGGVSLENNGENNWRLWLDLYRDEADYLSAETLSMNLPATISSTLATTATIEMTSTLNDETLNEDYQILIDQVRRFTEYGLALGGVIIKPYIVDDRIAFDIATPELFVPLAADAFGEINHIVFIDEIKTMENNKVVYYRRLEEHDRTSNHYRIANRAFKSGNRDSLGKEVPLKSVDAFQGITEEVEVTNVDQNLYGYFKNPQANNLDLKSPLGVSCFSRATSLIKDANEQYSRLIWEVEGSELAIDADATMFKGKGLEGLPVGKERLFRKISAERGFYEVFNPTIRDESLLNVLNEINKKIEDACGLSRGMISEVEEGERSATEVRKSKQRLYSTVVDIQKEIQKCLEEAIYAMEVWTGKHLEATFDFDDSVVVDAESEKQIQLQEVAAGIRSAKSYLIENYGLTEEEASKIMPAISYDDLDNGEFE